MTVNKNKVTKTAKIPALQKLTHICVHTISLDSVDNGSVALSMNKHEQGE